MSKLASLADEQDLVSDTPAQAPEPAFATQTASTELKRRTAGLVHDLRSPVCSILAAVYLIRSARGPDGAAKQDKLLDVIDASARHMDALISDIVNVASAQTTTLPVRPVQTNLLDVLERSLALVEPLARKKALDLSLDLSTEVPPSGLNLDPLRLQQVLVNLLANAIRFTDHGRVLLAVHDAAPSFDADGRPCRRWRIEVRDTGEGMSAAQLQALRDSLTGEQARTPSIAVRRGGTGLGLAQCARTLRCMDTSLHVDSAEGMGTRVGFTLSA